MIKTAVWTLSAGWICCLGWYAAFGDTELSFGFAVINLAMAAQFWRMSRLRWFPAPLFFLHALQIVNYLIASALSIGTWWQVALANRIFDVEVAYILCCALFRIARRRKFA